MTHPDLEFVRKVLSRVLSKKRFSGWEISDITYQFMSSQYQIKFNNGEKEVTIPVFVDFFEAYERDPSMMTLKKIKDKLKQQLIPHDLSDDD